MFVPRLTKTRTTNKLVSNCSFDFLVYEFVVTVLRDYTVREEFGYPAY